MAGRKWSREEETLLVATADAIWKEGITRKELAHRIKQELHLRSEEAIKKRLTVIHWKPAARPLPANLPNPDPSKPSERPSTPYLPSPVPSKPSGSSAPPHLPSIPSGRPAPPHLPSRSTISENWDVDPYKTWKTRMSESILKDLRDPTTHVNILRELTENLRDNKITTAEGAVTMEGSGEETSARSTRPGGLLG